MNSKKIISGLLALSFVFGGAVLPNVAVSTGAFILASAEDAEVLTYGDFDYTILEDGTVEIAKYNGEDEVVEIPGEIDGKAVTSIGALAFYDFESGESKKVTSIVIPDSVTTIKHMAFGGCYSVENITLPKNLKCIEDDVFFGCRNLKSIDIPDGVKEIGTSAFAECESLESVTLPEGLTDLGEHTFGGCRSLKNIVIPDGVECIKYYTFENCPELKSFTFPKNLKRIEKGAFEYSGISDGIILPDGLEYIGDRAFFCASINVDIVIPNSVKSIGEYAFANCQIPNITIPGSVTDIGDTAFKEVDCYIGGYKPSIYMTLNCYKNTAAYKYALANGSNFKLIDADGKTTKYPELIEEQYNSKFKQFRLNWTAVKDAEQYGVAVKLAGKWKVHGYTDTTSFTSPKLTSGAKYQAVICAKVNGKWNTSALNNRAFTLVVR